MAPLGLIAGDGRFPIEIARAAKAAGRDVVAVGFHDLTDPALAHEVSEFGTLFLGELESLLTWLRERGVREAVMSGKVTKEFLYAKPGSIRPDARAVSLLAALSDRGDDTILSALAGALEEDGVSLLGQATLVPDLVAREGCWGARSPSADQMHDASIAWRAARALGGHDIGQSVVVKQGAILAVEAIEGTDATIRRGGALGGPGAVVAKVAKPNQDPRFDLPAVGLGTMAALAEVSAAMLVVEAGATIVLDREDLVTRADELGIVLMACGEAGPRGSDG